MKRPCWSNKAAAASARPANSAATSPASESRIGKGYTWPFIADFCGGTLAEDSDTAILVYVSKFDGSGS
jgi:hypothetical protein